jgi:CheY-like chemotaxis protein
MQETKIKVLIVDDDASTRDIYKKSLLLGGFDVIVAHDGVDGYKKFQEFDPAVVLTGIEMSRMSGFDLVEKIRKERKDKAPFFIINSHLDREEDRKKSQALKVDGYFVRGFASPIQIISHIQNLVYQDVDEDEPIYSKKQFRFLAKQEIQDVVEKLETQEKRRRSFLFGVILVLGGLVFASWVLFGVFLIRSDNKELSPYENGVPQTRQGDPEDDAQEDVQTEPLVRMLGGEVVALQEGAIEIETEIEGQRKILTVKTPPESTNTIIKSGDRRQDGTFEDDRVIAFQDIATGDSISFFFEEDITVSDIVDGNVSLKASEIFVGPPADTIKE